MSQSWVSDLYEQAYSCPQTLGNMEKMFETLRTSFSGGTDTTDIHTPGGIWYNPINHTLRLRNSTNAGWLGIMLSDLDSAFWICRHYAEDGWVVIDSVADKVIAIQGGTKKYQDKGGQIAGSFELGHSHTGAGITTSGTTTVTPHDWISSADNNVNSYDDAHNHNATLATGKSSVNSTSFRPAALVGTLQRPVL